MKGGLTTTFGVIILGLIIILMFMVFVCSAGGEVGESVFCQPFTPIIDLFSAATG